MENTKPLQGAGFRLFRSKIMGIPENYDDEAERVRTHPQLLPKPKEGKGSGSRQTEGINPTSDSRTAGAKKCVG